MRIEDEKGQALPLALVALAMGALVVTPFLTHVSTGLTGSRIYGLAIMGQYSCDAGVEHAMWDLTNGGLAEQLPDVGDSVTYQLGETINGATTSITVAVDEVGGEVFGGIVDEIIDTLEFDTSNGFEPDIVHVLGDTYAMAYRGPGNDGFLKTVEIATDGQITDTVIDTLEFDTSNGFEPDIVHISDSTYAIAYCGPGNDGFLKTVGIAADGQITDTVIDTLEFDTSNGYEPDIVHISGSICGIVYRGTRNDGFLKTVEIAANGQITDTVVDTLEFDTSNGYEPDIVYVSGDTYVIAYRGPGNDGFLKTVGIAANGQITDTVIDTLEYDTSYGYEPDIVYVSGDTYAIAYHGSSSDGFLKTVEIAANGQITDTVIDTLEYDTSDGYEPDIVHIFDSFYVIAYRGTNNDGFLKTVEIAADGQITDTVIDTLEFDTSDGYEPNMVHISGGTCAIAYRGPGNDGFLKTVKISASDTSFTTYTIDSTTGESTTGAEVRIEGDSDSVTVLSWVIER